MDNENGEWRMEEVENDNCASPTGFEPVTSPSGAVRSVQTELRGQTYNL